MYKASDEDGVLDAMFVSGDSVGMNANDVKWSEAVKQELVIYADGECVCILIIGCDKC